MTMFARRVPADPASRGRLLVLLLAGVAMIVKLHMAATSLGTDDVRTWQQFAATVHRYGPIGIYAVHSAHSPLYNHPPLIGWLLVLVNHATRHGFTVAYLIRAIATVADVFSALLIFELVRARRSIRQALLAGVIVAVSPVLFAISGFHGNTDPTFVMFLLLSVYLLADRDLPLFGGLAFAVSIGLKLVPIVALPALVVGAARSGLKRLVSFAAGVALGVIPFWAPVIARQWKPFRTDVLGYQGTSSSQGQWGLVDLARHLHSTATVNFLIGPGRFIVLLVCALLPALYCLRRGVSAVEPVGLSMALFLLLTPAFGPQYLAWGAATLFVLDVRAAIAYNAVAGILLFQTYTRWSGGFPWYKAHPSRGFDATGERLGWAAWACIVAAVALGMRAMQRAALHPSGGRTGDAEREPASRVSPTRVSLAAATDVAPVEFVADDPSVHV